MLNAVALLILAVLATPLAAEAQQAGKAARLGMLLTGSPATRYAELDTFTKTLGDLGWVEGQNLVVERRWAEGADRFAELTAGLIRSNVSVIVAPGPEATRAATAATSTTPIVMVASANPRVVGITSLAHPGGNLTGLTIGQVEVVFEKRLEFFKEAIPGLSRVALLWDVNRLSDIGDASAALARPAQTLGLRLQHLDVKRVLLRAAFKAARGERAGATLVIEGPRAVANRGLIADLGLKNRLPVMSQFSPHERKEHMVHTGNPN